MTQSIQTLRSRLADELGRVVVGAQVSIRALVIALVSQGHVLIQGVPGLGKTLLAKALARALGGEFKRSAGHTGSHAERHHRRAYLRRLQARVRVSPGPLFAEVVLVDEINRAGPKTQSALLEAMEERAGQRGSRRVSVACGLSRCSPRRTRASSRAPIRCPSRSSIASCFASTSTIPCGKPSGRFSSGMARSSPVRMRRRMRSGSCSVHC